MAQTRMTYNERQYCTHIVSSFLSSLYPIDDAPYSSILVNQAHRRPHDEHHSVSMYCWPDVLIRTNGDLDTLCGISE